MSSFTAVLQFGLSGSKETNECEATVFYDYVSAENGLKSFANVYRVMVDGVNFLRFLSRSQVAELAGWAMEHETEEA